MNNLQCTMNNESCNHQVLTMMEAELDQAVWTPQVTPLLLELDSHRITVNNELPEEVFLFRMLGAKCFPRKELSVITGQAKSGKTFFTSLLMAKGIAPKTSEGGGLGGATRMPALQRIRDEPLKVMWYDTEQSQRSTQDILKNRILTMVEGEEGREETLYAFNVRGVSSKERLELLTEGVATYRPDLVVLDGVRDLVVDINDGVKATETIERLMKLAEEFDCCIACVLHQNRSADNRGLRGWLGTELTNKAFEICSCEKIRQQTDGLVFGVKLAESRRYSTNDAMYYVVGDDGLPMQTDCPSQPARGADGRYVSRQSKEDALETLNQDYIIRHDDDTWEWDLSRLFREAMGPRACWSPDDLMNEVMRLSHIRRKYYYNRLAEKAEELRIVKKTLDRYGRVVVILLPEPAGVAAS